MSSFRRRLINILKRELPYIELDYIESTGTQYIDTGYIPTINTDIKTRASVEYNSNTTPVALFGYLSGSNPYNRYAIQYHQKYIYCAKGKTENTNETITYSKMCDIETQGDKYIYDGTTISVAPLDFSVSNTLSIILFARQTTSVNRHSKARMEYFRIYENNILVQYLIPVIRKLDGKVCMYDKISKQFFENEGTGEFIPGTLKNLPEGYAQLDYLESTGNQYIDLDIVPTNKIGVNINCMALQNTNVAFVGAMDTSIVDSRFNLPYMGASNNSIYWSWNTVNSKADMAFEINKLIELNFNFFNNRKVTLNENTFSTNLPTLNEGNNSLYLFAINRDNIQYYKGKGRIYNVKISDEEKIIMNLIPMLDEDEKPCMYDIINGISYYNQGTEEFIVGSILKYSLPTKYKECKWLQGDLNSYIDTGILPNNKTSAEVKFTVTDLKNTRPLGVTDGKNRFSIVLPNAGTGYLVNQIGTTNKVIESKQMSVGETATIKNDKGKLYYNGSLVDTVTPNTFNIDMPIFIAAQNSWTGTISALDKSLIEYVKLWKNNILVMYMLPCLDENNVPCMYDLVRRQTFYNSGNGEFLYELKED